MRVVFMGTPEFAVPSLLALTKASDVVGVFCRPDAVSGRGKTVRPSPIKVAAEQLGLLMFQPRTLRDDAALDSLVDLAPDLLVVAAYGLILPPAVLGVAPLGAINVHASLLPRWRGAAPIQRAILAGDDQTGVSIMRMEEGLDTGPYCLQVSTAIGNAGADELIHRLARIGADALTQALPSVADDSAVWTAQDETLVTYADKITKDDVAIEPTLSAEQASRRIRASVDSAPCRVSIAGRSVRLVSARVVDPLDAGTPAAGCVALTTGGVLLGVTDGALVVERLKPDGKSEMPTVDWARGVHGLDGASWEGSR